MFGTFSLLLVLFPLVVSAQTISTFAGNGTRGYCCDGGPATSAELFWPSGVAFDSSGNTYIADSSNNRIRKVFLNGTIITFAGNGTGGYSGDGGPATSAQLRYPTGVAVDSSGNVFIADANNNRVRKVFPNGTIVTIAGNGTAGYSGDGGPATSAELYDPFGVAVDSSGNVFIADSSNNRIREVFLNGTIVTFAGNGTAGYSGDGGPATSAQLYFPYGVAVDSSGNVFIADTYNNRIREVFLNGTITTFAGNGTHGYSGDGGPATSAELHIPSGMAVDSSGNLFIADQGNNRIREVFLNGTIVTIAGNGTAGYSGNGGPATSAKLNSPTGVAIDSSGNIYIADTYNMVIRKVTMTATPPPVVPSVGTRSLPRTAAIQNSITIKGIWSTPSDVATTGYYASAEISLTLLLADNTNSAYPTSNSSLSYKSAYYNSTSVTIKVYQNNMGTGSVYSTFVLIPATYTSKRPAPGLLVYTFSDLAINSITASPYPQNGVYKAPSSINSWLSGFATGNSYFFEFVISTGQPNTYYVSSAIAFNTQTARTFNLLSPISQQPAWVSAPKGGFDYDMWLLNGKQQVFQMTITPNTKFTGLCAVSIDVLVDRFSGSHFDCYSDPQPTLAAAWNDTQITLQFSTNAGVAYSAVLDSGMVGSSLVNTWASGNLYPNSYTYTVNIGSSVAQPTGSPGFEQYRVGANSLPVSGVLPYGTWTVILQDFVADNNYWCGSAVNLNLLTC